MTTKILVVEDNVDSRDLLHHLLTIKGLTVSTAVDGREGVYMAKAGMPDLIITDLTMPDMDGVEMIKQIRAQTETADIPIVAYTAYGSSAIANEALDAGASRIFMKPLELDQMLQFIADLSGKENDH